MRKEKINNMLFAIEVSFFFSCAILFLFMQFFCNVDIKTMNIIYIVFIIISFGWLFGYEFLFPKYDNAVHCKMFAKYYIPSRISKESVDYKRKGLIGVLSLWFLYLLFLFIVSKAGCMTCEIFLVGASLMFCLNSIFTRKVCLLSKLFLKNKNNCCKNCGINSWDYSIFASALFFSPRISLIATILNYIIVIISFVLLIIWEYNYKKHPYRFYPETNLFLSCKHCLKQCAYSDK